jgi:hypothetical protein
MAIRNLEVVITITDKASKDLDKVNQKLRNTGDAAKKANVDFTGFNRTLFATTAFVGTFLKAFQGLSRSFQEGADLDRLSNQFERVFGRGTTGSLTGMIRNFTDTYVDEMALMREATALRSMGIVKSLDEVVQMGAMASVAAKAAGKTSEEGMKEYFAFLKDGEVSHLQNLNLIHKTNSGLMAQNAVLGKYGGLFNQLISTQAKKALGDRLLYQATKDLMKGSADLADTLGFVGSQWKFLKGETGRFLLTAMQPLLDKFGMFLNTLRLTVATMKDNKNYLFLAKTFVVLTGATLGLAGALGTLRLASIALASLGFGLPRLIFLATTLGTVFLGVTDKAQKLSDKIKIFGGFIRGVWQLITSLNRKTGIAQIDEDLKQLLEENGLFVFAQNVARVGSVIHRVFDDMRDAFRTFSSAVDGLFGGIGRKFINMISRFKEPWENFWVSDTATPMQKFVRNFAVIGGTIGSIFTGMIVKTLAGKALGAVSKIPGLGFLGGAAGGRGPKGTSRDPIYTRAADGISSGIGGMFSAAGGGIWDKLKGPLMPLISLFTKLGTVIDYTVSYGFAGLRYVIGESLLPILRVAQTAFTEVIAPVLIFGSAIYGAVQGVIETASEWGKFFQGIFDLGKAVGAVVLKFIESIPFLKYIKDTLVAVASGLYKVGKFLLIDGPLTIMKLIAEGWKKIFGWLGIGAGKLGESMSALAKNISPDSFSVAPATPIDQTALVTDANNTAGGSGQKTNISVPQDQTSEETVDSLGQQLKGLSDSQRKQAQKAVEDALSANSEGGAAITAEEMELIMKSMQNKQVDLLGEIADNTRPIKSKQVGNRRE